MAVYNGEAYLQEAIDSVLQQTFQEFEFIIINDGSTDRTAEILERYQKIDRRIIVLQQDNAGLITALNWGCQVARGQFIARMDADDISSPHRFKRQLEYIEKRPEIGVLGTWIHNIDRDGVIRGAWRPPINPKLLEWTHFFGVSVSHPTVLMRRKAIGKLGFYRHGTDHVEDVDLWLRASSITQFGNVPEILFKYRTWHGGVSKARWQFARESHVKLLTAFIGDFLTTAPSVSAVAGLRQTRAGPPLESIGQICLTAELILNLHRKFLEQNDLTSRDRKEVSWDAGKKIAFLALQASRFDMKTSMSLFMQALEVDYRLLAPSYMMKGLRFAMHQKFKKESKRELKSLYQLATLLAGTL